MLLVKVKEGYEEKLKRYLLLRGVRASVWYECSGDEEVVIVPDSFACDDCLEVELERCGEF
ncbi:MAG: hypothetical protein Q9N26_05560 [Aquificota bacterium]|nr:hypothetical protein [Aquificota bacterium]